jgi:catalase
LISNLVGALRDCRKEIQDRMVSHFTQADPDYGRRVADGLKAAGASVKEGKERAVQEAEEKGHPEKPY